MKSSTDFRLEMSVAETDDLKRRQKYLFITLAIALICIATLALALALAFIVPLFINGPSLEEEGKGSIQRKTRACMESGKTNTEKTIWCASARNEQLRNRLQTSPHSPQEFRVIGSLQNFPAFSEAFGCKAGTYMNPKKKCELW